MGNMPISPPFDLLRPLSQTCPVVLASPHSGRDYIEAFVAEASLGPLALRQSEDAFVDHLFSSGPSLGMPLLSARFPRAWCDANREPWELDPAMFDGPLPTWVNSASPRVGAGLGTIAKLVAAGAPIYRRRLSFREVQLRVHACWEPYHAALAALIAETKSKFGICLLIDCHSMPRSEQKNLDPPDFILGDLYGSACSPYLMRSIESSLQRLNYNVRRNDPYAGGYITRHYGQPKNSIHVIQIEIARTNYLDEKSMILGENFVKLQEGIKIFLQNLLKMNWAS